MSTSSDSLYPAPANGNDSQSTPPSGSFSPDQSIIHPVNVPQIGSDYPLPSFLRSVSLGNSLVRQVSTGLRSINGPSYEWRSSVSIEDRLQQRARIKAAYEKTCPTYEALLDAIEAMDEELLFAFANSRVDYGKAGIDYESRVRAKRQQLAQSISRHFESGYSPGDEQSNGSTEAEPGVTVSDNGPSTEAETLSLHSESPDEPAAKRRKQAGV